MDSQLIAIYNHLTAGLNALEDGRIDGAKRVLGMVKGALALEALRVCDHDTVGSPQFGELLEEVMKYHKQMGNGE